MSREPKKVRKTLRYWLKQLRATENRYIKIDDDYWWGKPGIEEGYSVYIGDADTYDSWVPQPYAYGSHKNLSTAIELAIEQYEISKREFLMKELSK